MRNQSQFRHQTLIDLDEGVRHVERETIASLKRPGISSRQPTPSPAAFSGFMPMRNQHP